MAISDPLQAALGPVALISDLERQNRQHVARGLAALPYAPVVPTDSMTMAEVLVPLTQMQ